MRKALTKQTELATEWLTRIFLEARNIELPVFKGKRFFTDSGVDEITLPCAVVFCDRTAPDLELYDPAVGVSNVGVTIMTDGREDMVDDFEEETQELTEFLFSDFARDMVNGWPTSPTAGNYWLHDFEPPETMTEFFNEANHEFVNLAAHCQTTRPVDHGFPDPGGGSVAITVFGGDEDISGVYSNQIARVNGKNAFSKGGVELELEGGFSPKNIGSFIFWNPYLGCWTLQQNTAEKILAQHWQHKTPDFPNVVNPPGGGFTEVLHPWDEQELPVSIFYEVSTS